MLLSLSQPLLIFKPLSPAADSGWELLGRGSTHQALSADLLSRLAPHSCSWKLLAERWEDFIPKLPTSWSSSCICILAGMTEEHHSFSSGFLTEYTHIWVSTKCKFMCQTHSEAKHHQNVGVWSRKRFTAGQPQRDGGSCLKHPKLPKTS